MGLRVRRLTCPACNRDFLPGAVKKLKRTVREQARAAGHAFAAVGVSKDWTVEAGVDHLGEFGPFDEITGRRNFSAGRPADSSAFVLNEAAAEALGWTTPQEAVGEQIRFFGDTWRIIGVVKDFHYQSMRREIAPLALQLGTYKNVAALRVAAGQVPGTIEAVEDTWAQFTEMPFSYQFLDARIEQLYQQERRTARVLGGFARLALLLACLGLFALATYAVERRTKEISIRKVMGASVTNIVTLLSKDFLKLLALALVIAAPLAYFGTRRWLEGFAYHVSPGPLLFLAVGAGVLVAAFLAVGYRSVRAALANPAEHLRNE